MNCRIIKILLLLLILSGWTTPSLANEGDVPPEVLLLERINVMRENPAKVLASHGVDAEPLLTRIPEIKEDFYNGMVAFDLNPLLDMAADDHLAEMLLFDYYSKESLDGRLPLDRFIEQGYVPELSGETLSMLGFGNFMAPSQAVDMIFTNMLRDEIDKSTLSQLTLLHPEMRDIGIGFGSGMTRNGMYIFNMYLAVCDFGKQILSRAEQEVFSQINTIRHAPDVYAEIIEVDIEDYENTAEITDLFSRSLPALKLDRILTEVAAEYSTEMLENNDAVILNQEVSTINDRILEKGYRAEKTDAAWRMQVTVDPVEDPEQAVITHLARIFSRELADNAMKRTLLNPDYTHIGISVIVKNPGEWSSDGIDQSPYYNLTLTVIFARGLEEINQF